MFNGIMVIPNLIAIFVLLKESRAILSDYEGQIADGERLHYDYSFERKVTN